MVAHRLRQALGLTLAGFVLAAAISFVSAQEGSVLTAVPAAQAVTSSAMLAVGNVGAAAVAQTPPPPVATAEEAAASTQPMLVSERAWSDGHTTIVECTGDVTRTCQVNVYGPTGEFILGRKISPSGEAADCSGPCLDSTGAPLDASSVSRAQATIASGSQTHKVIVSAGAPLPPAVEEAPAETQAEPLHREGE